MWNEPERSKASALPSGTVRAAIYCRLSKDDELQGESASIANQRSMLQDYCEKQGWEVIAVYQDDGFTGLNMDRPDFQRMLKAAEAGMINLIITKDMSRIGRNYLETGFYTEVMFRQYGVHFIAIANNVDSDDQNSSEFAPFLNIMNEYYLRDCSRKISAAYQTKGRAGKPTTNHAIYGYVKDPEDKDHWLVDEEAAAIVRRIYRMTVEGHGPYDIARILRNEKIECPAYYLAARGRGTCKTHYNEDRPYDWYGNTVSKIIAKPEYKGHTVNFRTRKKSYKDKRVRTDPKDWLIFENTHEAIIDPETWQLAQDARKTVHRTDSIGEANPLTGLMFCADCGSKMYNHRIRRKPNADGSVSWSDGYDCAKYRLESQHEIQICAPHNISTKAVRALVLDAIRRVAQYALTNEQDFIQKVREASEVQQEETAKNLKRKLRRDEKRCKELDTLLKKLYESMPLASYRRSGMRRFLLNTNRSRQIWRRLSPPGSRSWTPTTRIPPALTSSWHWQRSTRISRN
ncbi:MAG: recombinase family protein [Clostridiales bacterium]|nr:recombinase family protein [Clostridiales bacterium]